MVDSVFVSRISEVDNYALTVVSLAFPVQNIMIGVATGIAVGVNALLSRGLGEVGKTVFGAYFKLQSFVFMPVFGINNAVLAISAYNYGARKPKRIMQVIRCGALGAAILMLTGIALFELFPETLLGFFNPDAQMLEVGVPALRILCLPFVFAGPCIIFGGVFQALGKSLYSMIVSIARQLVVLIPAAYLLSLAGDIDLVWLSFPIAEIASMLVSVAMLIKIYRKKIKPLYQFPEITS